MAALASWIVYTPTVSGDQYTCPLHVASSPGSSLRKGGEPSTQSLFYVHGIERGYKNFDERVLV